MTPDRPPPDGESTCVPGLLLAAAFLAALFLALYLAAWGSGL